MRISKANKVAIERALKTINAMYKYRDVLRLHLQDLNESESPHGRMALQFLTHFTSKENADKIIKSGVIQPHPEKGYISFTALHPIEFRSVASKERPFGFSFLCGEVFAIDADFYTPISYLSEMGISAEIKGASSSLATRLLMEPSKSQQASINFINMMEVRTTTPISLEHCALFFRNDDLGKEESIQLQERGIFQLPTTLEWFRDHFIDNQSWYYSETDDHIEFFDNRVCRHKTDELIRLLEAQRP